MATHFAIHSDKLSPLFVAPVNLDSKALGELCLKMADETVFDEVVWKIQNVLVAAHTVFKRQTGLSKKSAVYLLLDLTENATWCQVKKKSCLDGPVTGVSA